MVTNRIYISCLRAANSDKVIKKYRITHVLTVCPIRPTHFPGIVYKIISISDSPDHRIDLRFEECFEFIQDALGKGGRVLIHCFQGVSRSASVVLGYLIAYHNMSFHQSLHFLKEKRGQINPNYGFIQQLQNYANKLGRN